MDGIIGREIGMCADGKKMEFMDKIIKDADDFLEIGDLAKIIKHEKYLNHEILNVVVKKYLDINKTTLLKFTINVDFDFFAFIFFIKKNKTQFWV
jgi:hypothetical protein